MVKKKKYQKRKYVKRTRKYKILKGGLGDNDKVNIDITDRIMFRGGCNQAGGGGDHSTRENKIMEFERYLFGSAKHAELWKQILQLCFDNSILFYILTSGSKFGIIRTFQLLELDDFVTEVLCNNPSVDINPINKNEPGREDFKKMNKYQIIERIIAQPTSRGRGIFVDNDERNRNNSDLCPNIKFKHARGIQIDRFDEKYQTRFSSFVSELSIEYKSPISRFSEMSYDKNHSNLVNESILDQIITDITTGEIRYLFADFDGTMSPWRSALPFHVEGFNNRFYSHFNVVHVEN